MPKRRKNRSGKSRRPKKWYGKYKNMYGGTTALSSAVPAQTYTVLKYGEFVSLDPGIVGLPDHQVFRANGIFDPNFTGIGHQPMGHDEWAAFYSQYEVEYSTIEVQVVNNDNANPQMLALSVRSDSSTSSTPTTALESSNNKWTALSARGGQYAKKLKLSVAPAKFLGVSKRDPDINAPMSADPANQCYYHLTALPLDGVSDALPVLCAVTIKYYCRLHRPLRLSPS